MKAFAFARRRVVTTACSVLPASATNRASNVWLRQSRNLFVAQVSSVSRRSIWKAHKQPIASNAVIHFSGMFDSSAKRYYATPEIKVEKVPTMGDAVPEGTLGKWNKAVGDSVQVDESVAVIETDKTTFDVNATVKGTIHELCAKVGETVKTGQPLFKIAVGEAAAAKAEPKAKPVEQAKPAEPAKHEPPKAAEHAPHEEPPKAAVPPPAAAAAPSPKKEAPTPPPPPSSRGGSRGEHRERVNRMRARIAERLKDSQNTYAMLTTFQECDMYNLVQMRNELKDEFLAKHKVKLGFMSAFVKAAAAALHDQPVVNALFDEKEIVYRDYVDISVAVATPRGLVVPVLRDVDKMSFADVEKHIAYLGEKARKDELTIEEMAGGTFTISNGGVYGSMMGTPIINPPQSAILGMHAITDRAVVVGNEIKIRPVMYLALTYDHRLIDGREAVTFLRKIKHGVEDPRRLLLEL